MKVFAIIFELLVLRSGSAAAFSLSPSLATHYKQSSTILAAFNDDNDGLKDISPADRYDKISALNKMFSADKRTKPIPILTDSRRKMLQREIELLSQLDPDYLYSTSNPDAVESNIISELWSIWYGERGASSESSLRAIEDILVASGAASWPKAEKEYLKLIEENCGGIVMDQMNLAIWVEPANRLATLLYIMGRLDESKKWCECILSAKPWHIGALSGVVMVCAQLNDELGIIKWAQQGLPRLSMDAVPARKAWVERNVAVAKQKLSEMEAMSQKGSKGDNGTSLETSTASNYSDINDDTSWQ